jgi:hypothetical protein
MHHIALYYNKPVTLVFLVNNSVLNCICICSNKEWLCLESHSVQQIRFCINIFSIRLISAGLPLVFSKYIFSKAIAEIYFVAYFKISTL